MSACTNGYAFTEYCVNACTDVFAENTGVRRSMYPYIYTEGTDMHAVTSMDKSKLKEFLCSRIDAHDKYRRYKPIQYICTDVVWRLQKSISYADTLQQCL